MDELKTCPICGSKLTIHGPEDWKPTFYDPDSGGDPYNAVCDCGFQFSIGYCEYDEFIKALNRRPAPENKPLTLEQLKRRNSPVWAPLKDGTGYWCLCQNGLIIPPSGFPFMAKERPNWTFLDRQPEQEEK